MAEPSWDDLVKDFEDENPDTLKQTLGRVGASKDGQMVKKWLMRAFVMREVPVGASDSALRDMAAERRLAMKFLRLLESPIDDQKPQR